MLELDAEDARAKGAEPPGPRGIFLSASNPLRTKLRWASIWYKRKKSWVTAADCMPPVRGLNGASPARHQKQPTAPPAYFLFFEAM